MKKVLFTIIFMFVCSLLFIDNVKADQHCYGVYYDDDLGYWTPTSTYGEPVYTWEGNVFCFTEANGIIGAPTPTKTSMSYDEFYDNFYVPNKYRHERDLSDNEKMVIESIKEKNSRFTVYIAYDYSDVQEYYNKTGEFPPYLHFYYRTGEHALDDSPFLYNDSLFVYLKFFMDDFIVSTDDNFKVSLVDSVLQGYILQGYQSGKTEFDFYIGDSPSVDLNQCFGLDFYLDELSNIASSEKDGCYSLKYIDFYNDIKRKCNNFISTHPTPENGKKHACTIKCSEIESISNKMCNFNDEKNKCGIGPSTMGWFMRILKIGRYIVPVLVIILSILDFITAIASGEEDALKKAGTKFAKRIVAAILIFLLPAFLQFLFDTFKIKGLSSSNPYCMK